MYERDLKKVSVHFSHSKRQKNIPAEVEDYFWLEKALALSNLLF